MTKDRLLERLSRFTDILEATTSLTSAIAFDGKIYMSSCHVTQIFGDQ